MYSYVLVDKTREVYTKKENNIEYVEKNIFILDYDYEYRI